MNVPRVSIVIPCYNAERFISDCLDSCLQQTYFNFEIICVNDGSTDQTGDILKSYSEKCAAKIKVFTTPNRGVSHARNLGTANANADWIQYLDADDLLLPSSLEKKVNAFTKNPGADAVYTDWKKLIFKDGAFVEGESICRRIEDVHADQEIALFTNFWAPTGAYLYRKSVIEKIGGWNVNLPIIQDARFALDFALHKATFFYIPEILCLYRTGHETALSKKSREFNEDCYRNARDIHKIWIKRGILTQEKITVLLQVYFYIARSCYRFNQALHLQAIDEMRRLDTDFLRVAPLGLRWVGRLIGYEKAEAVAFGWRNAKKFFSNLRAAS